MSFDICKVLSSPWLYVKTRHIAATSMPTNLWCEFSGFVNLGNASPTDSGSFSICIASHATMAKQ